jgi:hypothetical protein
MNEEQDEIRRLRDEREQLQREDESMGKGPTSKDEGKREPHKRILLSQYFGPNCATGLASGPLQRWIPEEIK